MSLRWARNIAGQLIATAEAQRLTTAALAGSRRGMHSWVMQASANRIIIGHQMKRLTIVVPYRNRAAHLKQFVAHVRAYFSRDKADWQIPYQVLVIEQEDGLLFNRGALKNIGFLLGEFESDYTCFHDVDYLPIWADYSYVDVPTAIVWYGAEARPIAPGSPIKLTHSLDEFFGAAVLVPNGLHRRVNGYSNSYWGWGSEDRDLRRRFLAAGIKLGRRRGTFTALDHIHEGLRPDGTPTRIANVNRKRTAADASGTTGWCECPPHEQPRRRPRPAPVQERQSAPSPPASSAGAAEPT
jgi:hypothetical protein